jgi:hypothetical protein
MKISTKFTSPLTTHKCTSLSILFQTLRQEVEGCHYELQCDLIFAFAYGNAEMRAKALL